MPSESCSNCHYYRGFPLTCRVNPPQLVMVMTDQGPGFLLAPPAETPAEYWCGSYKPDSGVNSAPEQLRILQ